MQRFKNARNIVSALSPKPVFFLGQARSMRYSSSSSNDVSFAQAHANGPETTQRPLRALPSDKYQQIGNGRIFLTMRQRDLFTKPTLIEKRVSRKKYLRCYAR